MKKEIWKYKLTNMGIPQSFEIPLNARFLDVQLQGVDITLWFQVDPRIQKETRNFLIVGTGHPFDGNSYLGTVQERQFVWHIFEVSVD